MITRARCIISNAKREKARHHLKVADMVGLEVCLAVMDVYLSEFGDSKYRPCPLLREMVAEGRLGLNTGRGVYQY